jgi:SAM-dependent methyltransferase
MNIFEYVCLLIKYRKDPFFVKYLENKRVLDVGCGRGGFLSKDPKNFIGVDIDQQSVDFCNSKRLTAYKQSVLDLCFEANSFDAIHASQLIEHFSPSDAVRVLCSVSSVLKPGGIIFLTTPGVKNVWDTFSHIRPYPPSSFKKLLSSDTESYMRNSLNGLYLDKAWGFRFYTKIKLLTPLFCLIDLIFKPSNPIGWTIILKKKPNEETH